MPTFRRLNRLTMLVLGFLILSGAHAQSAARVYTLLIVDSQKGNPYDEVRGALLKALAGYGYVDGRNLKTNMLVTGNDIKAGEDILSQEVKKAYDVIFVGGSAATISAKQVLYGNMQQPVVFGSPTDPVGIGVIQAFDSAPTANFTGVCYPVPVKARLRFIKRLLPHAKTFGLVYADMPQSHSYYRWLQDLISHDPEFADIRIISRRVPLITGEDGDVQMAQAALAPIRELNDQVDAFIKPNDQMGTRRLFAEAVYKTASKPLIGIVKDDVMGQWGATAVIYPSHDSIGEQAARMIKELFEGKSITQIPPEWPAKYGFAVDLPKTRQFNITVPVELLQLAAGNIIK